MPVAADDRNFCIAYAGHATSAGTAAHQQNCGFDTPPGRWSTDNAFHLNWCLDQFRGAGGVTDKLVAARTLANSEEAARGGGLQTCQADAAAKAAGQKAYADQRAFETQVTGKTVAQCQQSNQQCIDRITALEFASRGPTAPLTLPAAIARECEPYFGECLVNAVKAANAEQAGTAPAPGNEEQPPSPTGGGQQTASTCGLPGGTATVVIPDPAITTLNVRDTPAGNILAQIPEGSQVNVVGGCSVQIAAGIVAQQGGGQPPVPGWCAISSPQVGCVKDDFLVAGIPAGGQVGAPGTAGLVAIQPQPQPQPAPQPQPQVQPQVVVVPGAVQTGGTLARLTKGANIRNKAEGGEAAKTGSSLPAGTLVTVLECTSHWCRIALPQFPVAWVSRSFLAFDGAAAEAPQIDVTINIGGGGGGAAQAPVPAPAEQAAPGGGQPTTSTCGLPGGTATVVIAAPAITTLNVRDKPMGSILSTIPEGSQVNVVGGCGVQLAAGIVAQQGGGQPPMPGWCAITGPAIGCVSEQFLVAGIPAGGQGGPVPAAGLTPPQPQTAAVAAPTFTGTWNANAQGSGYVIMLNQNGNNVTGSYIGGDGSNGQINGTVSGNVLRFQWSQPADQLIGAGKFTLSADGSSFTGSYTLGTNPDVADGSWNGTRR